MRKEGDISHNFFLFFKFSVIIVRPKSSLHMNDFFRASRNFLLFQMGENNTKVHQTNLATKFKPSFY